MHLQHSGIYFVLVEFNSHKIRVNTEFFESMNDKTIGFCGCTSKKYINKQTAKMNNAQNLKMLRTYAKILLKSLRVTLKSV